MKPFKNLINKFNSKQPTKLHFYEIEKIMISTLDHLLSSSVTEGDVFGIEFHVRKEGIESHIFTTPSMRMTEQEVSVSINPALNYQLVRMKHGTFFPIYTTRGKLFSEYLKQLSGMLLEDEEIVIQTKLHKRQGNWRNVSAQQLVDYVEGVDQPTSNPLIRKAQNYLFEKVSKRDINEEKFDALERKIREDNFRFEMIIGTFANTDEREDFLVDSVRILLEKFDYMNQFEMSELDTVEEFHSTTFHQYEKQYLSISEIYCLVSQERMEGLPDLPETEIEPVITSQENNSQPNEVKTPIKQTLNNMPSLDLLPKQIKTNENDVDKKIPERIKNALKRVRLVSDAKDVKVIDFKVGDSLIKTTINIPNNKNFSDIKKKSEDIQVALGSETLSVVQGEIPDSVSLFIPRKERQPIYLRTLLQTHEFMEFAKNNPLPFVVGKDPLGTVVTADLNKLTHLLVSGQTDSGKSVWLNQMILTLLMMRNPSELMMYLIDPKQVEFEQFRDFPQVVDVIDDMKKANNLLERLTSEMEKRYTTMKKGGAKKITVYNEKFPDKKLPYIVVVIDEYADLKTVNPVVDDYLARLGQKARGAGIHLVVATQRPDASVIDKTTANNLPSKISFRLNDNKSYTTVFGTGIPYILNGYGHGVMRLNGQVKDFEQFQGAIVSIDANEEEEVFDRIKKSFKGERIEVNLETLPMEIEEVEEVIEEEPIDKLKRIIANTGETRTGKLQKEMAIGMDKVLSMMQELVDEGWLYKHAARSKGYELIASNEELNKWRDEPIDEVEKEVDQESDDIKVYEKENNNVNQVKQYTEDELNKLIDEALDNKDKEAFKKYSKLLKELKGKNED